MKIDMMPSKLHPTKYLTKVSLLISLEPPNHSIPNSFINGLKTSPTPEVSPWKISSYSKIDNLEEISSSKLKPDNPSILTPGSSTKEEELDITRLKEL